MIKNLKDTKTSIRYMKEYAIKNHSLLKGETVMKCKHDMIYYIYDCDGFICEGCKKEVYWAERD